VAFQKAKQQSMSADVLAHYNSNLPLVLAGDASALRQIVESTP